MNRRNFMGFLASLPILNLLVPSAKTHHDPIEENPKGLPVIKFVDSNTINFKELFPLYKEIHEIRILKAWLPATTPVGRECRPLLFYGEVEVCFYPSSACSNIVITITQTEESKIKECYSGVICIRKETKNDKTL